MTRCLRCHKPAAEADAFCRHCGAALARTPSLFWRRADWLDAGLAWRSLAGSALVFGLRVLVHPLLMPYLGERHEGRVLSFHLILGLGLGLTLGRLRRGRPWIWALLGLFGAFLSWCLDFAYMANHVLSQAVFYVLNWLDSSASSNAIATSFGILQTLRFLGPVLVLGMASGWKARPALQFKCAFFCLLALAFRFPLKGFALAPGLLGAYPAQSALYLASVFALLYGLGGLDSNSAK
jgi:hypothetical protein